MRRLSSKKKAAAQGDTEPETSASARKEAEPKNSTPSQKNNKKTPPKKRARSARNSESADKGSTGTFEVDSIVGSRIIHGQQQYKVHWKGYPSSNDTWELETNLNCDDLVKKYLKETEQETEQDSGKDVLQPKRKGSKQGGTPTKKPKNVGNGKAESDDEKPASSSNATPEGKGKKGKKKVKSAAGGAKDPPPSDDEPEEEQDHLATDDEEYEVEQILNCLLHRGDKWFLVRWKGYGAQDDTWEPESNLSLSRRLVEEYLTSHPIIDEDNPEKRTRESPRRTTAFPVSPTGKRHSRRSQGRNRATYFDQE